MIAAKELRMGNLIIMASAIPEEVTGETFVLIDEFPNLIHLYKPIPLTEGWKDRFQEDKESSMYLTFVDGKYFAVIQTESVHDDYFNPEKEIKFVHEYQNLYKAWEGEELTIKEL